MNTPLIHAAEESAAETLCHLPIKKETKRDRLTAEPHPWRPAGGPICPACRTAAEYRLYGLQQNARRAANKID